MDSTNKQPSSNRKKDIEQEKAQKISQIKELLGKDKMKLAIHEIIALLKGSNLFDKVIIQMAVFTDLEHAYINGIIDWKEARKEKNKLIDSFLRLVNLFDKPDEEINKSSIKTELEKINQQLPKRKLFSVNILSSIIIVALVSFGTVLFSQFLPISVPNPTEEERIDYFLHKKEWKIVHDGINELIGTTPYSLNDTTGIQASHVNEKAEKLYKELKGIQIKFRRDSTFSIYDKALFAYDAQVLMNIRNMTTPLKEFQDSNLVKSIILGRWSNGTLTDMVSKFERLELGEDYEELYEYVETYKVIDDINYQLLYSMGKLYYNFDKVNKKALKKLKINSKADVKEEINNIYNRMNPKYKRRVVNHTYYPILKKLKDEIIQF